MKALSRAPLVAVMLTALGWGSADASYCGAARYNCCGGGGDTASYACSKQQCHTVMKTCKEVVYERQNYTCYKTVYEPVCEERTIDCVKYVRELAYRNCEYTVCKPVYETKTRTVHYTV
jgi:hypothetical protein